MNEETAQARRKLIIWALALNIVAWGAYFYLTKVMGIDFESIRQAKLSG